MLKPAYIFSNHMVLQRQKKICFFGKGEAGRRIIVRLTDAAGKRAASAENTCKTDGSWVVYLREQQAAENLTVVISDGQESVTYQDVSIGEVWLAGGQSNMEMELQNAEGGRMILDGESGMPEALMQRVRYYYTPKYAYECEELWEAERNASWELFGKEAAAKWSAVAFFAACRMAERLQVTVGIVGCNWGGTSASAWMSREALLEQEATRCYVENYENADCVKKSREEQIQDYNDYLAYHADWEKRAEKIYEKDREASFDEVQRQVGECKYPGPVNCANFTRPYGLYEVMLKKNAPYTLRGFLYYQGENDDFLPDAYYQLLGRMIQDWRELFLDNTLPFLLVQLPMHRYMHDPDRKNWCIIREAQMRIASTVKNAAIANIIDCGEFHEIHPKNKKTVGERLALQALYSVYERAQAKEALGPVYRDYLYRDGGMEITFENVWDGFVVKGNLTGFELAGEDGRYYPAQAFIGEDQRSILLKAEAVRIPVAARYLWSNFCEVTLFGKNGIPAAPFRTHWFDWKAEAKEAEEVFYGKNNR